MSVRKVKLSQLQQEGREYLRKQRLLKESLQKQNNQLKEEEQVTSPNQEPVAQEQPQAQVKEQVVQSAQSAQPQPQAQLIPKGPAPTAPEQVIHQQKNPVIQEQSQSKLTGSKKIKRMVTNQKEIFHNKERQVNPIQVSKGQVAPSKQQLISDHPSPQQEQIPLTLMSETDGQTTLHQPVLASKTTVYENYLVSTDESIAEESVLEDGVSQLEQDLLELSNAGSVIYKIPVFFSHQDLATIGPAEAPPLSSEQQFVIRMFKEIKNVLLFPRTLPHINQFSDTRIDNIQTIVKASYGTAAVLVEPAVSSFAEPYNPFSQFEPAMAYNNNHPLLLVIQDTMTESAGGVWGGKGNLVPFGPLVWHSRAVSVDEFFEGVTWKEALFNWASKVRNHYFTQTGQRR
ncbi:hypothetical protein [Bacillus sp. DNRA2]|uniref:hypothetical protein n=1 Tax=Bacillus sp. DNRA2 TaxID=2723053 RepID=UPI002006EC53|nr:hypothetical protein [Bacillus sp. DNRA2]